jgi:hypothetical protein
MSARAPLAASARLVGLPLFAAVIERYHDEAVFEGDVPLDPRLELDAPDSSDQLLSLMVRRGLDLRLVAPLLRLWSDRPLERALIAWDTLASALLPVDDEGHQRLGELRALARPLTSALPVRRGPGDPLRAPLDLNRWPARLLVERLSGMRQLSSASTVELMKRAFDQELAALGELARRADALLDKPATRESLRRQGQVYNLAHLPSLAGVHLDLTQRVIGHRAAGVDLCEVYLDAGVPERIPGTAISPADLPGPLLAEQGAYLTYRTWAALGEVERALALFDEALARLPAGAPSPTARLTVVRAYLSTLLERRPVSLERVQRLTETTQSWRYGQLAGVVVAAAQSAVDSPVPAQALHAFVTAFGSVESLWADSLRVALDGAGWKREAFRVLLREALCLPHEPSVWRGIARFVARNSDELALLFDELQQRLVEQSRVSLAS